MTFKDLIPFAKKTAPVRREDDHPLLDLRREMDRLFDDFFRGFSARETFAGTPGGFDPRVDVTETDKEFRIKAELPGMDEKDVDVTLTKDLLTLRGEKRDEHEEKNGNYYRMERSFGSFSRSIALPGEVDQDKIAAAFRKGVLTITLPKTARATDSRKKIKVEVLP